MKKKIIHIILGLIPVTAFLLIWQFIIASVEKNFFLFSSPSAILKSLMDNIKNGILPNDIFVTGQEAFYGFILGNACGAIIGLSLWYSKPLANLARPYIFVIGAIPIFSIAPMTIMWFGTGMFAKVMLSALSTIIISITQTYEGARQVDEQQVNLFHSFGATRMQVFSKLIIPSSLVWLFNSLKLNISFALLGAFIAEFISADEGLGHRIFKAGGTYDVSLVLASLICIIVLAILFSGLIRIVENTFFKWQ